MIRAATPDDIVAITAIYRHAVMHGTGTFEIEPPDATEMAIRHARVVAGGCPYLIAEHAGEVVGYAYACAYHARPAYRFTLEDSIYVRADAQGRGFGRALLDNLIDTAATAGFRQMIAVIGDSGNKASIEIHSRAGFVPVGALTSCGWKADRWIDVVLMQRPLGTGNATDP